MLNRRVPFHGLLAVLMALMALMATGASVPRLNPLAQIISAEILCHAPDGAGGTPAPAPTHLPFNCLICPLCAALHAPAATLVSDAAVLTPSSMVVVLRSELPPPSTAPPSPHYPFSQPRAPPTYS